MADPTAPALDTARARRTRGAGSIHPTKSGLPRWDGSGCPPECTLPKPTRPVDGPGRPVGQTAATWRRLAPGPRLRTGHSAPLAGWDAHRATGAVAKPHDGP